MKCGEFKEAIYLYADDEMDEEVRVAFHAHVAFCPACARLINRKVLFLKIVRKRTIRAVAPQRLRQRILTNLPHRRVTRERGLE